MPSIREGNKMNNNPPKRPAKSLQHPANGILTINASRSLLCYMLVSYLKDKFPNFADKHQAPGTHTAKPKKPEMPKKLKRQPMP